MVECDKCNPKKEKIVFPRFDEITAQCKVIMSYKFPEYKNSWLGMDYEFGTQALQLHNRWWQDRLKNEVSEFLKAETPSNAKKELCDIINISCMIYENTKYYHDPYWRYG